MAPPRRRWLDLRTTDFAGAADWIAVLPIAAVEQHGPHLPLGTDTIIAEGHVEAVLERLTDDVPAVFLPVLPVGKSNEHRDFPGTLTWDLDTALRAWVEIGTGVARAGVRRLVVVTSHGGNAALMEVAARELRVRHGLVCAYTSWHGLGMPDGMFSDEELRHGIHGGEVETSLMLALRPGAVRLDRAEDFRPASYAMEASHRHLRIGRPAGFGWMAQDLHASGAMGNAAAGTAEKGRAVLAHAAERFIELLRDVAAFDTATLAAGPLGAP